MVTVDRQFLRSPEFLVAAALGVLVVAAGTFAAVSVFPEATGGHGGSCEADAPAGDPVEANVEDTGVREVDGHVQRTVAWTLDPGQRELSVVDACGNDGKLTVRPSGDGSVRVVAEVVAGEGSQVVEEATPRARFAESGDRLSVAVDQPRDSSGDDTTHVRPDVRVEIRVPSDHTPALDLRHDDGDATVSKLTFSRLAVRIDDGDADLFSVTAGSLVLGSDDGDVLGRDLDVRGDVDLNGDDGTYDLEVTSIGSGDWQARTDDARIHLDLPAGDEIGYDAQAFTDDGYSSIVLENSGIRSTAEGGKAQARSTGYEDRATRVTIDAVADDGTIEIDSR